MAERIVPYHLREYLLSILHVSQRSHLFGLQMDIQLPVLDGIQATKEIRRMERSANIGIFPGTPPANGRDSASSFASGMSSATLGVPGAHAAKSSPSAFKASVIIVALTASSFNSDRVAALAAGCNDFLNKPVDHKWLEKKIIEWGSMQYILLSGFVSRDVTKAAVKEGEKVVMPRDLPQETQRSFDSIPNEQAKSLANRLHIGPKKRAGVSRESSPASPSSPSAALPTGAGPVKPPAAIATAQVATSSPLAAATPKEPTVTTDAPSAAVRESGA